MKIATIRSAAAVFLVSLLSACGGSDPDTAAPAVLSAAPLPTALAAPLSASGQAPTPDAPDAVSAGLAAAGLEAELTESGKNPAPDCEPEHCQGLRIIDGNAEAYRFDAVRRSAAEAGSAS